MPTQSCLIVMSTYSKAWFMCSKTHRAIALAYMAQFALGSMCDKILSSLHRTKYFFCLHILHIVRFCGKDKQKTHIICSWHLLQLIMFPFLCNVSITMLIYVCENIGVYTICIYIYILYYYRRDYAYGACQNEVHGIRKGYFGDQNNLRVKFIEKIFSKIYKENMVRPRCHKPHAKYITQAETSLPIITEFIM